VNRFYLLPPADSKLHAMISIGVSVGCRRHTPPKRGGSPREAQRKSCYYAIGSMRAETLGSRSGGSYCEMHHRPRWNERTTMDDVVSSVRLINFEITQHLISRRVLRSQRESTCDRQTNVIKSILFVCPSWCRTASSTRLHPAALVTDRRME
jgi:hypothetical protein